jgi:hypothetical protein
MNSLPLDQQRDELSAALTLAAALKHWAQQMVADEIPTREITLRRAALALELGASAAYKTVAIAPFRHAESEARQFCG